MSCPGFSASSSWSYAFSPSVPSVTVFPLSGNLRHLVSMGVEG